MPRPANVFAVSPFLQNVATVVLVVFALHAAKPVLIPIALAVLIAFVLAPVVVGFERLGLPRLAAALAAMLVAALGLGGVGWITSAQLGSLARELPQHRSEIRAKIDSLRGAGGPMSAALDLVRELAADRPEFPPEKLAAAAAGSSLVLAGEKSTPVVVKETVIVAAVENSSQLTRVTESVLAGVEPLAAAGLIAVLVSFMLITREDLRDRMLGAIGRGTMLGVTRVLGDAAEKVSKFLLFQLVVNAGFGVLLAVGLTFIGVPYAVLWGFLAMILRFIPYVGTWAAALFPFALSFATSPDWTQPILVFAYFLVLDLITANVVEPLLFGHHTGVSPLALLVSAAFWAWLWGPLGLVLSTPITVCLAVIGQHVPKLRPLAMLLGDQPALTADARFYQRLLGKDPVQAAAVVAEAAAGPGGIAGAYDAVVVPVLATAARDKAAGDLTADEEAAVYEGVAEVLKTTAAAAAAKDLATKEAAAKDSAAKDAAVSDPAPAAAGVVIGVPAHRSAEGLPLAMMAQLLAADGVTLHPATTHLLPAQIEAMVEDHAANVLVVAVIPPGGLPQTAYLCRRLRKRFPELKIVVAYCGPVSDYDKLLMRLKKVGVTAVTTSVGQACGQIRAYLLPAAGR